MIVFVVSMAFSGMADDMTEEQTIGLVLVLYAGIIPLALCAFLSEFCTYICIFKIFESSVPEKAVKYFHSKVAHSNFIKIRETESKAALDRRLVFHYAVIFSPDISSRL